MAKMARNGASFTIAWRARRETALAGWGGRIRTSAWRNYRVPAGIATWRSYGTIHDLRDECERVKGARFGAGLLSALMNGLVHSPSEKLRELRGCGSLLMTTDMGDR